VHRGRAAAVSVEVKKTARLFRPRCHVGYKLFSRGQFWSKSTRKRRGIVKYSNDFIRLWKYSKLFSIFILVAEYVSWNTNGKKIQEIIAAILVRLLFLKLVQKRITSILTNDSHYRFIMIMYNSGASRIFSREGAPRIIRKPNLYNSKFFFLVFSRYKKWQFFKYF